MLDGIVCICTQLTHFLRKWKEHWRKANFRQIFQADERCLNWKCMLSRTCICKKEKSDSTFKGSNDWVTASRWKYQRRRNAEVFACFYKSKSTCLEEVCQIFTTCTVIWKLQSKSWIKRHTIPLRVCGIFHARSEQNIMQRNVLIWWVF